MQISHYSAKIDRLADQPIKINIKLENPCKQLQMQVLLCEYRTWISHQAEVSI